MAARLLLASDFDGTIAPIEASPEAVAMEKEAESFFRRAAEAPSVAVAFLSGRDLTDLTARTALIPAYRSGSHGHDLSRPDGSLIRSDEPFSGSPDPDWIEEATGNGLLLERKRYGVALHWRTAEGVNRRHPLVREFARWARRAGLRLIEGRCVLEATIPGPAKIDALRLLAGEVEAERIVYAGDDITDFAALEWAAARGRGFFMRSLERKEAPPKGVEPVDSLAELLARFEEEVAQAGRQWVAD